MHPRIAPNKDVRHLSPNRPRTFRTIRTRRTIGTLRTLGTFAHPRHVSTLGTIDPVSSDAAALIMNWQPAAKK